MYYLKYRVPLIMYSETERDPENNFYLLKRYMPDLDISKVQWLDYLDGQYCWIHDRIDRGKYREDWLDHDRDWFGFSIEEVIMDVTFDKGYYILEFVTELPFDTLVFSRSRSFSDLRESTLEIAVYNFIDGYLQDGIGEGSIGKVRYDYSTYEVWLGKPERIA